MEYVMWSRMLIFCVIPITVTSITISSNGNSPEVKIVGGTTVDLQKGFVPSQLKADDNTIKKNLDKTKVLRANSTKLAINERYRRLIPYMTFYYANDLVAPTREAYNTKNVEVEKAHIIEADTIDTQSHVRPKAYYQNKIPRYQGNRLTHFNIASANPTKVFYNKEGYPIILQNIPKVSTKYNPSLLEYNIRENFDRDYNRYIPNEFKAPSVSYTSTREPYLNFYQSEESDNFHYYSPEKEQIKYKLVPYENTPPVKNVPQIEFNNTPKKYYNIAASVPSDPVYIKPRPRPQYSSDEVVFQQSKYRKPPTTISENYYEQQKPVRAQPILESGFKPIISHTTVNTPTYTSTSVNSPHPYYETEKAQELQIESAPIAPQNEDEPQYYQYVVEQPTYKPKPVSSDAITLADLLNSLQLNKFIPKPITKENVDSSIRILIQALNMLKGRLQQSEVDPPVLSSPAPFEAPKDTITTKKPIIYTTAVPVTDTTLNEESYLAKVENPSQHLDDYTSGTTQRFPLPITSDEEGGTPGRPDIDYPILTTIPQTKFSCKTQRYKGFFADPETRCQVWHYCDLNGGQASFLCPNGTIFSQAGLTCDWWFNVKCSSTAQLYVLNESLYKYILPHSPKFPEDYSGPLVDKYLTLKFKEMEEEFKKNKNKNKQNSSEKNDSEEDKGDDDSKKDAVNSEGQKDSDVKNNLNNVSESSVIVATSGASGNVERLEE